MKPSGKKRSARTFSMTNATAKLRTSAGDRAVAVVCWFVASVAVADFVLALL